MDIKDIDKAIITSLNEAKVWVQLRIENGELVELLHHDRYDGFAHWSNILVVNNEGESVIDFTSIGMNILLAHRQKRVEDIVEAYLFRELYELA